MEKVHWSTIEWPLATYVILIQLPCERCCSSSSLSFSPQISTGGSSGAFQIRTVAAEHPRAVWIQFSLEHQFILSNLWIQFSVSGSFLEAHPGSWLDYAAAVEYFNLNKLQFHSFRQKFELGFTSKFLESGTKASLTFRIAFNGKRLKVEQDPMSRGGVDVPVTTVRSGNAIVLLRPFGAGEDATRRPRNRQIAAAI